MFVCVGSLRRVLIGCSAALILGGCDDQGFSNVGAEWDRRAAGPYYVVSASPARAVVSAKGRQVAIEPAKGFCLARESVETTGRSAFALIGDCALDSSTASAPRGARGELQLPRGLPGIITVSVSGDPGFEGGAGDESLEGLSKFLDTAEGRRMLGRSGNGNSVKVVESRRIGDGVYVMVDDSNEGVVPILDPKFWRAFIELNDRLAVVTVSGFRDRPLGREEMLKHLVSQVQTLRLANASPINEPGILIADRGTRRADVQSLSDLVPQTISVIETGTVPPEEEVLAAGPDVSPAPPPRPGGAVDASADLSPEEASDEAGSGDEPTELAAAPYDSVLPAPATRTGAESPVQGGTVAGTPATPTQPAEQPEVETAVLINPAVDPSASEADAAAGGAGDGETPAEPDLKPTRFAPESAPAAPKRPARV